MLGEEVTIKGNMRTIKGIVQGYEQEWGTIPTLTLQLSNVEYEFEETNNKNCRCTTKTKEEKTMSVKIKKQPKEISLEELKKGEEYEEVRIHINEEIKQAIEHRYGVKYRLLPVNRLTDSEIEFKEYYLKTEHFIIPYKIIEKIEVVEK